MNRAFVFELWIWFDLVPQVTILRNSLSSFGIFERQDSSKAKGQQTTSTAQHTTHKTPPKEHRTAHSSPQQQKAGCHSTTRSTEHGTRAPENTTQKACAAWQHQKAQGQTHSPGGGGEQAATTPD